MSVSGFLGKATLKVDAPLNTGSYSGRLVEIKDIVTGGKFGDYYPFIFEIDKEQDNGEWVDLDEPVELRDSVTASKIYGPKSKLGKIYSAAVGREMEEGEDIDTDNMMGKRFIVSVDKKMVGDKSYSNITGYSPWKRVKKEAAAAPNGKPARQAPDLED